MKYCFSQYLTLFSQPGTSRNEHPFHFGPVTAYFLELLAIVLCFSSVAYWTPFDMGCLSYGVISFCLFIMFMGFSRQEYWGGLPFLTPVDHSLSKIFTMTCLPWVALQGMALSFIELYKPLCHDEPVIHEGDSYICVCVCVCVCMCLCVCVCVYVYMGLPWWLSGKESTCQCRRHRFNPCVQRSIREGNGNPL